MNISNPTRRQFVQYSSALGLGMMAPGLFDAAGESGKRPNILFIFSDEHRWCSLPQNGMPELEAPHFARFAEQATSVDHCVSNHPVCVPYRAILQTGLYPQHNSAVNNGIFFDKQVLGVARPTIAQAFTGAGYRTGYIGKWHLGDATCAQTGYDFFHHWKNGDKHWDTKWRDVVADPEKWYHDTNYNAVGMTDHALKFMDQSQGADQPWMLMLSWNPPHARWDDAPQELVEQYSDGRLSVRPNARDNLASNPPYIHYHAHITAIDWEFGRLLAELEKRGLDDNTIVIYTSDHGSAWYSNGFFSKPDPIDETARVPFMIRWPGKVAAGRRVQEPIGAIDLYPTLCGLAGFAPPVACDGIDQTPLLLDVPGERSDAQLITLPANPKYFVDRYRGTLKEPLAHQPCRAIRTSRYTFAVSGDGDWMLYDNQEDPYQMNNLVDDPAHSELKEQLRQRLQELVAASEANADEIPAEIRQLPLPEKILATNEFYCLKWQKPHLLTVMEKAMAPLVDQAADAKVKDRIRQAAEAIYLERETQHAFLDYRIDLYSFWYLRDSDAYQARNQAFKAWLAGLREQLHAAVAE